MLHRIRQYIEHERLLPEQGRVLVALSGGADSVALLDILLRLGYDCRAVHCNFHLRGAESDRDEQFVRRMCEERGTVLRVQHFQTSEYAKEKGLSIEMAARALRYAWFEEERMAEDCMAIAVAHHANDQAETLLLNLQRGAGLRGIEGMHAKNGKVVRPLLCVTREDIMAYLTLRHLPHVEDSTNSDTAYRRNAIRVQTDSYSEAQIQHMAATCHYMQQYELLINDYIAGLRHELTEERDGEMRIHIERLRLTPAPATVLYELLRPYGFKQTDEIWQSIGGKAGKRFYAERYMALKDREHLLILPLQTRESEVPQITHQVRNRKEQEVYPPATDNRIVVDAKVADKPLHLRHWQEGDYFYPIGMKGKKKLQDFFTDIKLPLTEKEKVWLLCSGDDIVWVVGHRIDNRYKVSGQTERVAEISIEPER